MVVDDNRCHCAPVASNTVSLRARLGVTAFTRFLHRRGQSTSCGLSATRTETAKAKAATAIQARCRGWLQRNRTAATFRLLLNTPAALPGSTTRRSRTNLGGGLRLSTPSRPALHEAARVGDLPSLRQACDLGGEIDGLRFGFTALQLAAKTGRADALTLLLDRGASVHARATNGESVHGQSVTTILKAGSK